MFAKIKSCMLSGIDGYQIDVETDIGNGIPGFEIVGLGDTTIKEAKDRVRSAIKNSGYEFPVRKIIVNLSPADERKEGSSFDLAIAIGILDASYQIWNKSCLEKYLFIGELSLDGLVQPVRGVLPMAVCAKEAGITTLAVPELNADEASIIDGISILPVRSLRGLVEHLNGKNTIHSVKRKGRFSLSNSRGYGIDFSDVKGHKSVKRALEVAASGGHNLLMIGPPGCGKTMLAKRMPTILPPLTFKEAIEVTKIHSVAGALPKGVSLITERPFRSPHHSITERALIGGGRVPKPGEISMAHYGVLFMDELPEFSRQSLEMLRQPLEDGYVTISRLSYNIVYPAESTLICTANPCKCGKFFDEEGQCSCTPWQIRNYRSRISGPLLDRMDIQIEVTPVKYRDINSKTKEESSKEIRKRVTETREIQQERYKEHRIFSNSQLTSALIEEYCKLDTDCSNILEKAFKKLNLSARSYSRILKVSRTIADMERSREIRVHHIAEAIKYRSLDRGIS